jgi:hypothetical protein
VVRGVGDNRYSYKEYVILDLYIKGESYRRTVVAYIRRTARLVDNLRANILVGIDILGLELVTPNMLTKRLYFGYYDDFTALFSITL